MNYNTSVIHYYLSLAPNPTDMSSTTVTSTATSSPSVSNLKEIALAAKAAAASAAVPNAAAKPAAPKLSPEELARRQERQLTLLNSFADHLVTLTNSVSEAAAAKGYGWTKVVEYYLPGFDKVEEGSEITTVPRHAPDLTHWAGPDADPSKDGVPIVMLLQGVREHTKGGPRLRPDLLAGGKTALQLAQDKLAGPARLDCAFNAKNKSLIITAIWIEDDWAAFVRRRQQRQQRPFVPRFAPAERQERYVPPAARGARK
jgi:hypothetical protein